LGGAKRNIKDEEEEEREELLQEKTCGAFLSIKKNFTGV